MSVYRIKDSRFYQFDFQIDGYRFSGSTKCTDERDAEVYEDTKKAEARELVERVATESAGPLRLAAACDRWWAEVGQHGNERDLKHSLEFIKAHFGPKTYLHDVTNDMVSRLVQARRETRKRAGRVKDATGKITQLWKPISNRRVNLTTVTLLRRVMHRAIDNWDAMIRKEPSWEKHLLPVVTRPIREISLAEDTRLDEEETADYAALRRFATIMGLRRRNLLLKWSQVDFEQAVVRVIAKGGVPRTVPLTKEAYAILWGLRGHHPEHVFTFVAKRTRLCPKTRDPKTGERFKFIRGQRYPVTYYGMGSAKQRSWKRAGVDARIHDMRHTAGSRTLRAAGNLKAVQLMLGHSDIATTAKFYANVLLEDVRDAMEKAAPKPAVRRKKARAERP
jgi:integrase